MVKKIIIPLLLVFSAFLILSLYKTYAYDTSVVEETPSTTDLEYTFKIGNSSIKQITVDSGETRYYDIVLGNPNPAKISYSIYYEMVSPSTKPIRFSIEYTSKSTGESTGKVDKEGNIILNLVVTNTSDSSVTIKLGSVAGYVNGGELTLGSGQEIIPKKETASDYIKNLDDGTTGDSGSGVYKVHHDAIPAESSATGNVIPAVDDYRYYGESPNNYICLDKTNNTCEDRHLYRIIGSIYEENSKTNLLKVIKATPLADGTTNLFSWDCNSSYTGKNIWSTITSSTSSGSTLMKILNDVWINNGTATMYFYENIRDPVKTSNENNQTKIKFLPALKEKNKIFANQVSQYTSNIDFTNYGMSANAKSAISNLSLYYLGTSDISSFTSSTIYAYERGTKVTSGSANYWLGKIALMYLSDYGYASGTKCSKEVELLSYNSGNCNNYLYTENDLTSINNLKWTINTNTYSNYVDVIKGYINTWQNSIFRETTFPTFYLSSDVKITSGTGEENNPYTISK